MPVSIVLVANLICGRLMTSEAKIVLIGRNLIVREALRGALAAAFRVIASISPDELSGDLESRSADVALVIADQWDRATFDIVEQHCSRARIVLITSHFDFEDLQNAFANGVAGYLVRQMSTERLVGSLRLVAIGERVFPPQLVEELIQQETAAPAAEDETVAAPHLSAREHEILDCLRMGLGNKAISRRLSISEATVKVHVKAVFRKLNVSNRTQAAIWAVGHEPDDSKHPSNEQEGRDATTH